MKMKLILLSCLAGAIALLSPDARACDGCEGCEKVAKSGDGYCCGKGLAFGVALKSRKLYDALSGQTVDASKNSCPGCKKAADSNGRCDHCKIGIAGGKVYHSPQAYSLAKGSVIGSDGSSCAGKCEGCKSAIAGHGKCSQCNVGFVAGRMFKSDEDYNAARSAYDTILAAVKAAGQCEACAVALVTDGECSACKVRFKDGKMSKS